MDDDFSPKILDVYSLSNIRGPACQNNNFNPLNNHVNTNQQPRMPYRQISPKTIGYNAPTTRDLFNSMPLDSWARWVQNQSFLPHHAIPPQPPEKTELRRAINANKPVYTGANLLTGCVQNSGKISNTVGHMQQTVITKPSNESLNLPVNLSSCLRVGYHPALANSVLNTSIPSIINSSRQAVNNNGTTSSANSVSHNNISIGDNDKNINNVQMYNLNIFDKKRINKEEQKLESSRLNKQFNSNIAIKVEESSGHESTQVQDSERNIFEHIDSSKLVSQKLTNENPNSKEVECEITKTKNLKQRLCETSSVKVKEEPKSPNREVKEYEENGEAQETSHRISTQKKGTKSSSIVVMDDDLDDHESENEVRDDSSDSEYIPDDDEASSDDGSLDEDASRRIIHSLRKPPINRIFDTIKKRSDNDKEDKDDKSGKDKETRIPDDKDKRSSSSTIFNYKRNALLGRNLPSKASPPDHMVFSKSEELGLNLPPYLKILKRKLPVIENNNKDLTEKSERGKFIGKLKPYYRPILPKGTEAKVVEQHGKEERNFSLPNIISSSRKGNKTGEPSKVIVDLTKPGSPSLNTLLEKFQLSTEKIKQITKSLTNQTSSSEKQTLTNSIDLENNATSNNIPSNTMNLECKETTSVTEDNGKGKPESSVSDCDSVTEITRKQSSEQIMNPEKNAGNNLSASAASNVNQNVVLNKKQIINIGKSQIISNSLNKDIQVKPIGNDDTHSIVSSTMSMLTPVASNTNLTSTNSRNIITAISTNSTNPVTSTILQASDNLTQRPGKVLFPIPL